MVEVELETVRLFLHVLAATVWVGGQLTLAALVPAVRRAAPEATTVLARQFARIAWPAFGVLLLTGAWNASEEWPEHGAAYHRTVMVKLAIVALSGLTALLHARARQKRWIAVWGAGTGITALAALFVGIMLGGSH